MGSDRRRRGEGANRSAAADGSLVVKGEDPTSLTGCEGPSFTPTVEVSPEKHEASTPTGLTVRVNVPASTSNRRWKAPGVAEADIEATT